MEGKGRGVDGRFWGWLFRHFPYFTTLGCCAQVGQPMHSDTLHSFGLFFVCKTGIGGLCGRFSWRVRTGKGADLAGRPLLSGGREFPFIMDPTLREASQPAFSFSVRTSERPASGQGITDSGTSAASHTHTTSTTTTIFYVNNTTAVESPTPTFSTDTHTQGRRSWPQEGPTARRAAKYELRGIYPDSTCIVSAPANGTFCAPHQPSNHERSRHIAPQRRMTMMNEGNKMGIPGLYDECI